MVVVRVDFARARLGDAGATETFANEISVLRDAKAWRMGAVDDRPRFARGTIDRLAWALLGRGPELRDAVFQLVHVLSAAAVASPSGSAFETLFMIEGPVRGDAIADGLASALIDRPDIATSDAQELRFVYANGQSFAVNRRRLPILVALLEFILGMDLDAEAATERADALGQSQSCPAAREDFAAASNRLAAVLSRHLDAVLQTRTARDRIASVAAFLDSRAEPSDDGGPPRWRIDDESVLAFWEEAALDRDKAGDTRLFRSAHRAFVALCVALADGETSRALRYGAVSIDDPDVPEPVASTPDPLNSDGPLAALAEPPCDEVKFLNKAEAEAVAPVDEAWRLARDLPVSVLRSAAMGAIQNVHLNTIRFGRPPAPAAPRVAYGEPDPYTSQIAEWGKLAGHLMRARLAAAHVVATHHGAAIPAMADEARRAFRGLRRAGFAEALTDPLLGEAFEDAIVPLTQLSGLLKTLLESMPDDAGALYSADAPRFATVFRAIHVVAEET